MFRKSVSIDLVEPVICLRGKPKDKQTLNILRGAIRLELSHSAIVHSITIQFIGTSKTLWPEASQHWDKHILVDSIIPIFINSLLLKKGTHSFPFEILLSNALSESIECGLGHIRYKLLCQVHVKPRFLLIKSMLQTQRPVVLIRLPSMESQQECVTQTHVINELGGQLTLHIEKAHLIPGTLLPITINFNHSCLVHAVDHVSVKLVERQKYRAPSKQTTRILHHEIALSPTNNNSTSFVNNEMRIVYVLPDKHTLEVRPTTSHPNIRVRHWIQIYIRLLLKDGTTKDLQMYASISVLLSSMDDYLNLPVYHQTEVHQQRESISASASTSADTNLISNSRATIRATTVPHALPSTSIASYITSSIIKHSTWLKKINPVKNSIYTHHNASTSNAATNTNNSHHCNNLMMLMTAPPPLYEDIATTTLN